MAIPCQAVGHPPPTISWKATYGGDQIEEEGKGTPDKCIGTARAK